MSFYVNGGVRELIPIYPLYAIMFGEHGVSPMQLSFLFMAWAAVGLVTEVPSGALADRLSRKWLVVLGGVFKSTAFLSWYLWQNFNGYLLGFVLWGIGSSIRSGAWEALLHDLLKDWQTPQDFTAIYGRIRAIGTLCVGAGELLGGVLIIHGYDAVLLVSMAVPLIASIPFAIFVYDAPKDESIFESDYLEVLKTGLRESVENTKVLYILLVTSLLIMLYGVYDEFTSPTLREKGFSLQIVAFLGALVYFAEAAGMALASKLDQGGLDNLLLRISAAGIILLSGVFLSEYLLVACLAAYFFVFGLSSTLLGSRLQSVIESPSRATVTSVINLGESIGAMTLFLTFGFIAEFHGMIGGTLAIALASALLPFLFIVLARKWQVSF